MTTVAIAALPRTRSCELFFKPHRKILSRTGLTKPPGQAKMQDAGTLPPGTGGPFHQPKSSGRLLFWKLVRKNSELVNLRRLGKQIAGLGLFRQSRRHFAVEVRVPPGFVVKRIEDGERGWSLLNSKPRDRAWLSVHQRYRSE